MKNSLPAVSFLLDSARGVYIPQNFCSDFDLTKWQGIAKIDVETILSKDDDDNLLSPYDIEGYWDAWESILNSARYIESGNIWYLHQDGDLFAMCYDLMSNEERQGFDMELVVTHEYFIKIYESGEFKLDVQDIAGTLVFRLEGDSLFIDGFMSDINDVDGLKKYLIDEMVINEYDVIEQGN